GRGNNPHARSGTDVTLLCVGRDPGPSFEPIDEDAIGSAEKDLARGLHHSARSVVDSRTDRRSRAKVKLRGLRQHLAAEPGNPTRTASLDETYGAINRAIERCSERRWPGQLGCAASSGP